jgi:predicted aldo/keto reductase-like oxidoreductase
MRQSTLGSTGEQVSVLGCGTMWFADLSQAETTRTLNHALDRGVTYFDCARGYGDAEIKVGKAIGHRHDEFLIATKTAKRDRASAAREIDESLSRLGMDHLDLIQLHYVNSQPEFDQIMAPDGALAAAVQAQAAGKVRHIGITGHRPELLATWLGEFDFATVLFHLSPVQPFSATEILPRARELEVGTIAMRPVGSGAISRVSESIRYVHSHGVDVVLSGLTTPAIVDENVETLSSPIEEPEQQALTSWVLSIENNGCRRCNYCSCPVGIHIPDMLITEPLQRHDWFTAAGKEDWAEATASVHKCEGHEPCQTEPICESKCPYDLPIRRTALRVAGVEAQ